MTGTIQIQSVGPLPTPTGTQSINTPVVISGTCETAITGLASGVNTITPPSGSTAVILTPPPTNAATITLKGIAGDTGVALSKTTSSIIALSGSLTPFILVAGSAIAAYQITFV